MAGRVKYGGQSKLWGVCEDNGQFPSFANDKVRFPGILKPGQNKTVKM